MYNDNLSKVQEILSAFLAGKKYYFSTLKPSILEDKLPVVYAIFNKDTQEALYVGRTKNLRQRLYNNHLMGQKTNARLKKYLVEDPLETSIKTMDEAKEFLKQHCYFQYVAEPDTQTRAQLEGLFTYLLNVRYIQEEH